MAKLQSRDLLVLACWSLVNHLANPNRRAILTLSLELDGSIGGMPMDGSDENLLERVQSYRYQLPLGSSPELVIRWNPVQR